MEQMEFNSPVLPLTKERKFDIMGKTIKQRIARFCKKYPEPRQYKIQLTWNRKDSLHHQIVGKGENLVASMYGNSKIYTRTTGGNLYIQHYRYDEETELMECSYSMIHCRTPKENDERRWEYAERYFIPKEEKQIYDVKGNVGAYATHNSYGNCTESDPRRFLQDFQRLNFPINSFYSEFMKLTDNKPSVPPRYMEERSLKYPWILTEWIRYTAKPRNLENGKTQQRIDKMLTKQLVNTEDIKKIISNYRESTRQQYHWGSYYVSRIAYFDKANMVFRLFYISNDNVTEQRRVYIDGKKFLYAKAQGDKWVTNGSFTSAQFGYDIMNLEDVYSLPHCAYLRALGKTTVFKIVSIMRNAEVEQLYNMGFTNLAKRVSNNDSVASMLKETFGEPDKKKKNMCQRYHITKKQLEIIDKNQQISYRALSLMKKMLNTNDISSIDIESFIKYYNICHDTYYFRMFDSLPPEDRKKMFIRLANMAVKHRNAISIFSDTWYMATRHNIDIMNIRSYEELVRAHDAAMELQRIEQEERRRLWAMKEEERHKELEKKMEKLDKERAKLNYEEEDFLIRLPEKLSEIVTEGSVLRHCVGGYTDTHASGSSTIMFLRKTSEPDKPFYTIEVRNNSIIQIHGFGNRWLGCNPEAIPTVARWLKKNNIHCADQILRGTATGYRGNNEMVPMPEF